MTDLPAASRSERLDSALTALLASVPEVEAAAVVSFDGLPMASALPAGMDEERVAAMSAALLSLGERAAQGLGRGELSQVYIEGTSGTVFLVSAEDEAVLVAVAAAGAKAGLMLYEVRRAAGAVADVLRVEAPAHAAIPLQPTGATPPPAVPTHATPTHATPTHAAPVPVVPAPAAPAAAVPAAAVPAPAVPAPAVPAPAVPAPVAPAHAAPAPATAEVPAAPYLSPLESGWTPSYSVDPGTPAWS